MMKGAFAPGRLHRWSAARRDLHDGDGDRGALSQAEHQQTHTRPQDISVSVAQAGGEPSQSGLGDGHYLHPNGPRVRLSGCRARLVQPEGAGAAISDAGNCAVPESPARGARAQNYAQSRPRPRPASPASSSSKTGTIPLADIRLWDLSHPSITNGPLLKGWNLQANSRQQNRGNSNSSLLRSPAITLDSQVESPYPICATRRSSRHIHFPLDVSAPRFIGIRQKRRVSLRTTSSGRAVQSFSRNR